MPEIQPIFATGTPADAKQIFSASPDHFAAVRKSPIEPLDTGQPQPVIRNITSDPDRKLLMTIH